MTRLRVDYFGDLKCPNCGITLYWDDDSLYPFEFESVECGKCAYSFRAKQIISTTYEVCHDLK